MEDEKNMDNEFETMDLVDKFKLQRTDKIIIETYMKSQERPYIKKIITDKNMIQTFLGNLTQTQYLNNFIRGLAHYCLTFYSKDKEIFLLWVNDWKDEGFVRVNYGGIESDFFVDKSFFDVFHKMIDSETLNK
jgi:hypothetical protein